MQSERSLWRPYNELGAAQKPLGELGLNQLDFRPFAELDGALDRQTRQTDMPIGVDRGWQPLIKIARAFDMLWFGNTVQSKAELRLGRMASNAHRFAPGPEKRGFIIAVANWQ